MINNLLNVLKNNNRLTYILDKSSKYNIKLRYEFLCKNKTKNVFLYFDDWLQFKKIYDVIPNEYKHFYEIMEDKCKFFIDFDAKKENLDNIKWYKFIDEVKNILEKLFYDLFLEEIKIVEYESLGNDDEPKYSYHIIVENLNFSILECKLLCELLLKNLDPELHFIIDPNVYGKWRSLRIENSTKIGSKRTKLLRYPDEFKTKNNIYLNGLITNLNNTISVKKIFDMINIENEYKLNHIVKKEIGMKIISLDNSKKYVYNEDDVIITKKNYLEIEYIINKWHYKILNEVIDENKIFYTKKIIQNMILYKRMKPYNCPICKRIHENQDPYSYIKNAKLYFDCRRSNSKPIEVAYFNNSKLKICI
jgi:hypothetical protein